MLVDDFIRQLLERWLAHEKELWLERWHTYWRRNDPEIIKQIVAIEKRCAEEISPGDIVPYSEHLKCERVHGINIRKADREKLEKNTQEAIIKSRVLNKHDQEFNETHWPQFLAAYERQIKLINPADLLKQLFARHPWIQQEITSTVDSARLSYKFLELSLRPYLVPSNYVAKDYMVWSLTKDLQWPAAASEQILSNLIEGFPLSNFEELYVDNQPPLHSLAAVKHNKIADYTSWLNQAFTRLDLSRFLYRTNDRVNFTGGYSHIKTNSIEVDGIATPKIALFHFNELATLSPNRLNQIDYMLVNLESEDNPLWICLRRQQAGKFIAYVPKADEATTKLFSSLKNIALDIVEVNHTNNFAQNDIAGLDDRLKWHAVLLGRVLPFIKQTSFRDLSKFRSDVPVSIFLEDLLDKVLPPAFYKNNDSEKAILKPAFRWRAPFSQATLQQHLAKIFALTAPATTPPTDLQYLIEPSYFYSDHTKHNILEHFDAGNLAISASKVGEENDTLMCREQLVIEQDLWMMHYLLLHNHNLNTLILDNAIDNHYVDKPIYVERRSWNLEHEWQERMQEDAEPILRLFELNTSLLTVLPTHKTPTGTSGKYLPTAISCAARNRFLCSVLAPQQWQSLKTFTGCRSLRETTIEELINFYRTKGGEFNLDYIEQLLKNKLTWEKSYYNHREIVSNEYLAQWQFVQITQMGTIGLDLLFEKIKKDYLDKWDDLLKSPALNLTAIFDLAGGQFDKPDTYVKHFNSKLTPLIASNCRPLFKSLAFILPNDPQPISQTLCEILSSLNSQQDPAVDEVILYNLNISDQRACKSLLDLLLTTTQKSPALCVMIRLPSWDRATFITKEGCALKAKYRDLQNVILENQRQAKLEKLNKNAIAIGKCATKELSSDIVIRGTGKTLLQSWSGEDSYYPLISQAPGTQQQLAQELSQAYEHSNASEDVYEAQPPAIDLETYHPKDNMLLITRDTIEEQAQCIEKWQAMPEYVKVLLNCNDKSKLKTLFSQWVGSDSNATNVVTKIELDAVLKIMENPMAFRLGISYATLPPGFSLAISADSNGLVLCYDKKQETRNLRDLNTLSRDKRNPFTMVPHQPQAATIFRGDYRQLESLVKDDKADALKKTLWKYLATEDDDQARLAAASALKPDEKCSPADVSLRAQHYTIHGTMSQELPGTLDDCLNTLRQIVDAKLKQIGQSDNSKFLNALFDQRSKTCLTALNLKAIGQLCYSHEVSSISSNKKNATDLFFLLAQQIYSAFGEEFFAIWKKCLIDPSQNLSECLTLDEVDAVANSIVALNQVAQTPYRDIWWQLLLAHGKATGHMQYAPLWFSYERLIKYIEKRNLTVNKDSMLSYLTNVTNFHGQVFLERLHTVLRNAESSIYSEQCQQQILNNIHNIDWTHSGFYYASQFEKFTSWDEGLGLTGFSDSVDTADPSYLPWLGPNKPIHSLASIKKFETKGGKTSASDSKELNKEAPNFWQTINIFAPLSNLKTTSSKALDTKIEISKLNLTNKQMQRQHLRFMFKKMQLSIENNAILKQLCILCFQSPANPFVSKLLLAAYVIGVNQASELAKNSQLIESNIQKIKAADTSLLAWLSEKIDLDHELIVGSLHLKFEHLHAMLDAVSQAKFQEYLKNMSSSQAIQFVNACGRALQCFSNSKLSKASPAENLTALLNYIKSNKLSCETALLTATPWLILDVQAKNLELGVIQELTSQHPQISMLQRQLASIDFQKSENLPSAQELQMVLREIKKNHEPITRQNFIKKLIERGCVIRLQYLDFRTFDSIELKTASEFAHQNLINFKKENLQFLNTFFEDCVAIGSLGNQQEITIKKFLTLLCSINNKSYYNELSQIFGKLIQAAKTERGYQRYCLEQLHQWLELLQNSVTVDEHFPVNILVEILNHQQAPGHQSSLLSGDLQQLNASDLSTVENIKKVINLPLDKSYKHILVKIVLQNGYDDKYLSYIRDTLTKEGLRWPAEIVMVISLINDNKQLAASKYELLREIALTSTEVAVDPKLKELWQSSQLRLIDLIVANKHNPELNRTLAELALGTDLKKNGLIRIILMQAIKGLIIGDVDLMLLVQLRAKLAGLDMATLAILADYCGATAIPANKLAQLLSTKLPHNIIHYYETQIQATDPKTNENLRNYSIKAADHQELMRILHGIKLKGQGVLHQDEKNKLVELLYYINTYSELTPKLATLSFQELQKALLNARNELLTSKSIDDKNYASARVLACMREILLRKSGKWVNHTQMLDLIFAALHNNKNEHESLLHQVRTGQGKSIITFMRVAYLALNGAIVDVFSAKESLSKRDYEEFSPILETMGIPTGYITPRSSNTDYHDKPTETGIGAVNYATISHFSLFLSAQTWECSKLHGTSSISLVPKHRIAFLDECDHILQDDVTQCNYSDNRDINSTYNYDEWVYRRVYEFYIQNKFPDGKINRFKHLRALCEKLQDDARTSPMESSFIKRILVPALSNDPRAIRRRDTELRRLLNAAHIAHTLQRNKDFTVLPEKRVVAKGLTIDTRRAVVVIDNQIQHGSTYSNAVHQMLHARLNHAAIENNEPPNFFIEIESNIVLSSSAEHVLTNYYGKLEGCTGTAGNIDDLNRYQKKYGINSVIKLPTHEQSRSTFLPTIYCKNKTEQHQVIAKYLNDYTQGNKHPILVTCKDDRYVEEIASAVKSDMKDSARIIKDTNDSNKNESQIILEARKAGAITISSRLSRGTDIDPETDDGLVVLRTNPTDPRFRKQEEGRQGRLGKKGLVIEVIDYGQVMEDFKYFKSSTHWERLESLLEQQNKHLKDKLNKKPPSEKLHWLIGREELQEQYIITRSVALLHSEIKKKEQRFLRAKEQLITTLCGKVSEVLRTPKIEHSDIDKHWSVCLAMIEELWNARLVGKERDDDDIYREFQEGALKIWQGEFCDPLETLYPVLSGIFNLSSKTFSGHTDKHSEASEKMSKEHFAVSNGLRASNTGTNDLSNFVKFYQSWCVAPSAFYAAEYPGNHNLEHIIYGINAKNLEKFYQAIYNLSISNSPNSEKLISTLLTLPRPQLFLVSLEVLTATIISLTKNISQPTFNSNLEIFKDLFINMWPQHRLAATRDVYRGPRATSKIESEVYKISLLHKIIMSIAMAHNIHDATGHQTQLLIRKFYNILEGQFWEKLDDKLAEKLIQIFATKDEYLSNLLFNPKVQNDLDGIIDIINHSKNQDWFNTTLVNKLTDYLVTYHKILNNNPALIRAIFTQAIVPGDFNLLPPIKGDIEMQNAFSFFMSQHPPFGKVEFEQLLKVIDLENDLPDSLKKVFRHLTALPPYIPSAYITQQLATVIQQKPDSKSQSSDDAVLIQALENIEKATQAFNRFARSRDFIDSEIIFRQPLGKSYRNYEDFIKIFKAKSPPDNSSFFTLLSSDCYRVIPLDILLSIGKLPNSISTEMIKSILDLLVQVCQLPTSHTKDLLDQFKSIFREYLKNPDEQSLLMLTKAVDTIKGVVRSLQYGKMVLSEDDVDALPLFSKFENLNAESLEKLVRIWNKFKARNPNYTLNNEIYLTLRDDFFGRLIKPNSDINVLANKLTLIEEFLDHQTASLLSFPTFEKIKNALINNVIKSKSELEQCLSVCRKAKQIQETGNWQEYFGTKPDAQKSRILLRHYLCLGLLDLGEDFSQKFIQNYQRYITTTLGSLSLSGLKSVAQKHENIKLAFSKINYIAAELENLPKSTTHTTEYNNEYYTIILNYIEAKAKDYHAVAWPRKSEQRIKQAQDLFIELGALKRGADAKTYYYEALDIIMRHQRIIISGDKNTTANSKGYSRLYDITLEISLKIMQLLLTDNKLTLGAKSQLATMLKSHLGFLLEILHERTSNSELKQLLASINLGFHKQDDDSFTAIGIISEETLTKLKNLHNHPGMENHLKYLASHIGCLADLIAAGSRPQKLSDLTKLHASFQPIANLDIYEIPQAQYDHKHSKSQAPKSEAKSDEKSIAEFKSSAATELRGYYSEKDAQELIALLKSVNLVSYTFLSQHLDEIYIINHLRLAKSLNQNYTAQALNEMHVALDKFLSFTKLRGISPSSSDHTTFINIFMHHTPATNANFFALVNSDHYKKIPLEIICSIAKAWTEQNPLYHQLLNSAAEIAKLPNSLNSILFEQYWKSIADNNPEQAIENLNHDTALIKFIETTYSNTSDTDWVYQDIPKLYTIYKINCWTSKEFENASRVLHKINKLMPKSEELKQNFFAALSSSNNTYESEREIYFYNLLLSMMEQLAINTIPTNIAMIKQAWDKNSIATPKQLENTLKVFFDAWLHQDNLQYYFGSLQHNQQARITLMQNLYNENISLGEEFGKKCYEQYLQLITNSLKTPDLSQARTTAERQHQLVKSARNLVYLTKEINQVTSLISPDKQEHNVAPLTGTVDNQSRSNLTRFFTQQQTDYASAWFKNSIRRNQAKELFESLQKNKYVEIFAYCVEAIDKILAAQKDIMNKDVNTTRNSKGYSRLYDITIKMFIEVARNLLLDPNTSLKRKTDYLNGLITEQLLAQISRLRDTLPEGNTLKEKLKGKLNYTEVKSNLEQVPATIALINEAKDDVPNNLTFIVTNIACFSELVNLANPSVGDDANEGLVP